MLREPGTWQNECPCPCPSLERELVAPHSLGPLHEKNLGRTTCVQGSRCTTPLLPRRTRSSSCTFNAYRCEKLSRSCIRHARAACFRVDELGERPYWNGIPNDLCSTLPKAGYSIMRPEDGMPKFKLSPFVTACELMHKPHPTILEQGSTWCKGTITRYDASTSSNYRPQEQHGQGYRHFFFSRSRARSMTTIPSARTASSTRLMRPERG